jgi:putative hydrolase of the HAD superfamily
MTTTLTPFPPLRAVVFDWGDTLMRDFPQYPGPMAHWPRVRTLPGVRAALARLPAHLTCCVATAAADSDAQLVAAALARVRIRHHFRHLFTPREIRVPKSDPAFYRTLCRHLDLAPAQVLMVGDSLDRDVRPAHAAGLRTVWVTRLKVTHAPPDADAVIPSLRDLHRILQTLSQ